MVGLGGSTFPYLSTREKCVEQCRTSAHFSMLGRQSGAHSFAYQYRLFAVQFPTFLGKEGVSARERMAIGRNVELREGPNASWPK